MSSVSTSSYASEFQYGAHLTANQLLVQRLYHTNQMVKSDRDEQMKQLAMTEKAEKYAAVKAHRSTKESYQ